MIETPKSIIPGSDPEMKKKRFPAQLKLKTNLAAMEEETDEHKLSFSNKKKIGDVFFVDTKIEDVNSQKFDNYHTSSDFYDITMRKCGRLNQEDRVRTPGVFQLILSVSRNARTRGEEERVLLRHIRRTQELHHLRHTEDVSAQVNREARQVRRGS